MSSWEPANGRRYRKVAGQTNAILALASISRDGVASGQFLQIWCDGDHPRYHRPTWRRETHMALNHSRRCCGFLFVAVIALSSDRSLAAEPKEGTSNYGRDELVQLMLDEPFPVGFPLCSRIGASGLHQESRSDSANISIRSAPIRSKDGGQIEFVEFRVAPDLRGGANFFYAKLDKAACYQLSALKKKYEVVKFIAPPNPHLAAEKAWKAPPLYRAQTAGATLIIAVDETPRECVLSLARSRL